MYQPSGTGRLTCYKQGYLAGLGGKRNYESLKGRKAADYNSGYCTGLYWATLKYCEKTENETRNNSTT